jgi:DNA polymerase (family 10)
LTLKKINVLHDALNIENIADLRTACAAGLVRKVKGFGEKSEAKLLADIDKLGEEEERVLLHHALAEGERLLAYLRAAPELLDAELAGALRRRRELIRQISIVASSREPNPVLDRFLSYPALLETTELTAESCTGKLARGLDVELRVVFPENYAAVLHRMTGSRRHIEKLDSLPTKGRVSLASESRSGHNGQAKSVFADEAEIYASLGLPYIPPEMREDEGEIEAALADALPALITVNDIQGMIHCHTHYSDGQNTIEEMALAAEAMGMKYLTITDHSPTAYYARGVTLDRLRAQWDEIARVQERVKIKLLRGTESDITAEGALDYPDDMLERFDVIIASIHSRHKMNSEQMTQRLLRVLQLPVFKIWGHPLGRVVGSRQPIDCRLEDILDAIAASRAAIEINGDPHRLDLEPRWVRAARERGIKFVVSTDAHSVNGMSALPYGVAMARRGWLSRADILNSLGADEFARAVRP